MLCMGPKEWASSFRCLAKFEVWQLFLNAASCSLKRVAKHLPVCLTYALWQSGQVSLFTPDTENLSGVGFLLESKLPIVFLVWNFIFMSVLLKIFVMYDDSLPT